MMSPPWLSWLAGSILTCVTIATTSEQCKDYGVYFERSFGLEGEASVLNCHLLDEGDLRHHPHNLTWYSLQSGQEPGPVPDSTTVRGSTLWFFNLTSQHQGEYMCVVRTAEVCYQQVSVLLVEEWPDPGAGPGTGSGCVRMERSVQILQEFTNGILSWPLTDFLPYLDSYHFNWYRGCERVQAGGRFFVMTDGLLRVNDVVPDDAHNYTCVLHFLIGGVRGHMTQTIEVTVRVEVTYQPQILLLDGEISKVKLGTTLSKVCHVLVPGTGDHHVTVLWRTPQQFIPLDNTQRIHQLPQRQVHIKEGVLLEAELVMSEVKEEDFNMNFTCEVHNDRANPQASFRLQRDSNLLLPLGLVFGGVAFLLVQSVVLYHLFKIDVALLCRDTLPFLYPSTEDDGKVYDAYVVYPRLIGRSGSPEETFAVHTLPSILEGRYGYRLFILGRDCTPGEAVVEVMYSSLCLSRRVLLLYGGRVLSDEGVSSEEWGPCLERQLALQCSLVEEAGLSIVLVDMGGVADSALPPALQHLKAEQGALKPRPNHAHFPCWWEEPIQEEEEESAFINPSPQFWKQLRYHMPVRGKARHSKHTHTSTHTLPVTHTHTVPHIPTAIHTYTPV